MNCEMSVTRLVATLTDCVDDVHSVDDFTENDVLAVQPSCEGVSEGESMLYMSLPTSLNNGNLCVSVLA